MRLALGDLILSGTFERFPGLRVGSVEHELAWIPFFLDQMNYTYTDRPARGSEWYRFKSPDALPGELLELGRSCVARSHRNATTISRLWHAIIEYAQQRGIRYLFGCGSLHQSEVEQVQPLYAYLRDHYCAPECYRVQPVYSCRMSFDENAAIGYEPRAMSRQLAPVMKGYLRAGAMICSPPAFDAEFGTADVLVLLEMEKLTARYQNHFTERAA